MSKPSQASLTVLPVEPLSRVTAPECLLPEEVVLWRDAVDSKPADWFGPDSAPLLVEYVRAVCMCDRLAPKINEALEADDWDVYERRLKFRDMESKRAAALATKLRLTQQSRYTPKAAATADSRVTGRKPWAA